MHFSTLTLGLSALFGAANAQYHLTTTYDQSNFFDSFNFYNSADPTRGYVNYVDRETANRESLAGFVDGAVYMGVDYKGTPGSEGRKSIRVESYQQFTQGLFIADIAHMPSSTCGSWPAFWAFGPNWPNSGEIDILEGVNTQTQGIITLHTGEGCQMSNEGSLSTTSLKETNCNAGNGNLGCGQDTSDNQNYGDGFNAIGGGVYAMEWTSDHIAVWFFPRGQIPQDITSEAPNPSGWSTPTARFAGGSGCNIDSHFMNHNLVFDTTFCGDWAGSPDVWNSNAECSALASTCQEYVQNNPGAFAEAYWLINSVKVYNQAPTSKRELKPQPFMA